MKRTPEPAELMDAADQARAYAEADFSEANQLFIELFEKLWDGPFEGRALDLGCGPAAIPIDLARRHPQAHILAVDGAPAMLDLARQAVNQANLSGRVALRWAHLPDPDLPCDFDAILSNSLLHHLTDPLDLWRTLRRVGRPGAAVVVMDLCRPADPEAVERLVAEYAADAPPVLQRDFRASLHAAWRPDEVAEQLTAAGLTELEVARVSNRHLAVTGRLQDAP